MRDADHLDAGHECGLGCVRARNDHELMARVDGGQHRRQHAADRAQPPVQPELAEQHQPGHPVGRDHAVGGEHGDRHREVEAAAALGQHRG